MIRALFLAAILALCGAAALAQSPQKIEAAKSQIRFVTRQMNVPVEGAFRRFDGTVTFDPAKPEATRAEFEVDLASIDLGNAEGETEAKRKAWLATDTFPKARFTATFVKPAGPGKFVATGQLAIKGISQEITAPFTFVDAAGVRTVEGQFPLKRLQYKIGDGPWSDTDTVADEVVVRFKFVLASK